MINRNNEEFLPFLSPPLKSDEIGRLDKYRILRILGQGSMGIVFLAEDLLTFRQVAVKVMRPQLFNSVKSKKRFLQEAVSAGSMRSDHIVQVFHAGEANGIPFFVMEYLEGFSLDQLIETNIPLTLFQILRIAREIALGLASAHNKGLLHRDIKPANIWIERSRKSAQLDSQLTHYSLSEDSLGVLKLLDFGLARPENEVIFDTGLGEILGTPAYMAPEQARGELGVDFRADLFSLGSVLYHLCTNQLPFPGKTRSEVIRGVIHENPIPPHVLNKNIPTAFSKIILQMLEKLPRNRPRSAYEVIVRLEELEREFRANPGIAFPAAGSSPLELEKRTLPAIRNRPYPKWRIGILFAFLCLVSSGLLGYFFQTSPEVPFSITEQPLHPITVRRKLLEPERSNRKIAEWVLKQGGHITINAEKTPITKVEQIPPQDFGLSSIHISGKENLEDKELISLDGANQLKSLTLHKCNTTHEGLGRLAQLNGFENLTHLNVSFCSRLDDRGVPFFSEFKNLEHLDISGTKITAKGLRILKDHPSIRSLFIQDLAVQDEIIEPLSLMSNLKIVNLNRLAITDQSLVGLAKMKELQLVLAYNTQLTREGIEKIKKKMPNLIIQINPKIFIRK